MTPPSPLTRFAPAPTGELHLGHVVNAIYVWGTARARGGRVLLRIEDHDRQRARPAFERALLDDLEWLGFEADIYPVSAYRRGACEARQSERDPIYRAAIQTLIDRGRVYGCTCSRQEIENASNIVRRGEALASPDRQASASPELRYPGTCRDRNLQMIEGIGDGVGWRLRVDPGVERFVDELQGPQAQEPAMQCGDFLLRDRLGNWTYQLAVVVDDWHQGIDLVVRGTDLLASTGRQILLARLLGRTTPPAFMHHALVMKSAQQKLSKSDGDTGIAALRESGWSAARVIGHAASLVGLLPAGETLEASRVGDLFSRSTTNGLRYRS
jgi:glutamyl-Q tRNA(Asp) synthetase